MRINEEEDAYLEDIIVDLVVALNIMEDNKYFEKSVSLHTIWAILNDKINRLEKIQRVLREV